MSRKLSSAILLMVALLLHVALANEDAAEGRRRKLKSHLELPAISCPRIFSYKKNRTTHEYYGELIAPKKGTPSTLQLEVNMTVQAQVQNNNNIKIQVVSTQQEILEGDSLKYAIKFPLKKPLPKLIQAKFNNRIICSNDPDPLEPGIPQTAMWAKTTIKVTTPEGPSTEQSSEERHRDIDDSDEYTNDSWDKPTTDPWNHETEDPWNHETEDPWNPSTYPWEGQTDDEYYDLSTEDPWEQDYNENRRLRWHHKKAHYRPLAARQQFRPLVQLPGGYRQLPRRFLEHDLTPPQPPKSVKYYDSWESRWLNNQERFRAPSPQYSLQESPGALRNEPQQSLLEQPQVARPREDSKHPPQESLQRKLTPPPLPAAVTRHDHLESGQSDKEERHRPPSPPLYLPESHEALPRNKPQQSLPPSSQKTLPPLSQPAPNVTTSTTEGKP